MLLSFYACHAMCNLTKVLLSPNSRYVDYIFGNEIDLACAAPGCGDHRICGTCRQGRRTGPFNGGGVWDAGTWQGSATLGPPVFDQCRREHIAGPLRSLIFNLFPLLIWPRALGDSERDRGCETFVRSAHGLLEIIVRCSPLLIRSNLDGRIYFLWRGLLVGTICVVFGVWL